MSKKEDPIALSLLKRAHSPDSAARIYTEKVIQRPLHLKPTEPSPKNAQQARRLLKLQKLSARKKKLKPRPLSARQKRALCLYDIPKEAQKYSIYVPLHKMWIGYIQEVLWDGKGFRPVGTDGAAKLCSADFHGAELEVVRSRCVSRVGVKGIVVKDTKYTFEIITPKDQLRVVPKEHTIFRFKVPPPEDAVVKTGVVESDGKITETEEEDVEKTPSAPVRVATTDLIFELHGNQFIYRAADRANRKFKPHYLPDL